jgi:uncharacterized protein YvpB
MTRYTHKDTKSPHTSIEICGKRFSAKLRAVIAASLISLAAVAVVVLNLPQPASAEVGSEAKIEKATAEPQNMQAPLVEGMFDGTKLLNVPFQGQMPLYPTGCEAASVSMMVSYASGSSISVTEIINAMPYASDPTQGFVGDPTTWDGITIYPEAMLGTVYAYAGSGVNLTGSDLNTLKRYLDQDKPVVTWVGNPNNLHCVIVVGYEDGNIIYHDPYTPANATMPASEFNAWWAGMAYRALSY